jgi:predicted RNase H-like HicB family nuclease
MKFYTFKIIIEPEDEKDGGYYAYSPDLHGCYSNGKTVEETRANMQEAIEQHLEALC